MSRLVFLLEEYSMKVLLEGLLPRLYPGLPFLCVPHEGKGDLEKSIPRKLRAWREPGVRFVVVLDNDGVDCRATKQHIVECCGSSGRTDAVVRLACQELESWYFGDLDAVARVYDRPAVAVAANKARFRDPDSIQRPARALAQLVEEFQKVSGARLLGRELSRTNRSHSFQMLLAAVETLAVQAGWSAESGAGSEH